MRLTERGQSAGANAPAESGPPPHAGNVDPVPEPPDLQKLLAKLWQISHYGWIGDGLIRRDLTISGNQIPVAALAQGLRVLVQRGWVEQRDSDVYPGESEWRLTDSGRTHAQR